MLTNVLIGEPDSAPNISGSTSQQQSSGPAVGGSNSYIGALYSSGWYSWGTGAAQNWGGGSTQINFDASRSSKTYGRRNEIAPNSFTCIIWKRAN